MSENRNPATVLDDPVLRTSVGGRSDGVAVYRAAERPAAPRPAILLMRGYAEGSAYAEFLQATEAPVLLEPIGIDELRERVRAMLEEP